MDEEARVLRYAVAGFLGVDKDGVKVADGDVVVDLGPARMIIDLTYVSPHVAPENRSVTIAFALDPFDEAIWSAIKETIEALARRWFKRAAVRKGVVIVPLAANVGARAREFAETVMDLISDVKDRIVKEIADETIQARAMSVLLRGGVGNDGGDNTGQ